MLTPLKQLLNMKSQTTRTSPNYALLLIIIASMIFWLGIIKVFFGDQIKEWIFSIISMLA
jgi:hypothetical protein